jgi:hypothetical protein
LCAGGLKLAAKKLKLHFLKARIELQKPFDELDQSKLLPYKVVQKQVIPDEIVTELGTTEYIQWTLEDTSVARNNPARYVSLFITYYSGDTGPGNVSKVTHIPDVCYVGGGAEIKKSENTTIDVPGYGLKDNKLPIRVLGMSLPGVFERQQKYVLYFFAVNGHYDCRRNVLRLVLRNIHDKYSYYSKVEMRFRGGSDITEAGALKAAQKLVRKLLPLLVKEHWPKWPPKQN